VLANDAGIVIPKPLSEFKDADWIRQLDVNLNSVTYGTQRAVALVRKIGKGGLTFNISSVVRISGARQNGSQYQPVSNGGVSMGFRLAGLALLFATTASHLNAAPELTTAELVAKNLSARGGATALAAIRTLDFNGKFIAPGDFQLTYHGTRARNPGGDRMRDDLTVQGLTIVQAFDGRLAWKINPFQGRKDAERMSADESRAQADASLIDGVLLASLHDGSNVRYLGREDFDGTEAYKLQVRQKDGDQYDYLLDPDTFLEIRSTETRQVRGAQTVTDYEYGDYEKVGGVYFPMAIDSWQPAHPDQRVRTLIASAAANSPLDPSSFAQPGAPVATVPAAMPTSTPTPTSAR
jgi:hypothetical protein